MVAHAARFHLFILSKRLNIKLLFLVRHPLTNIRALQSWSGHLTKTQKATATATSDLARKWQRVARVYLDQQPTAAIFAAHMRTEDLLCSPVQTLQRVLADLLSHQQMYTSADRCLRSTQSPGRHWVFGTLPPGGGATLTTLTHLGGGSDPPSKKFNTLGGGA